MTILKFITKKTTMSGINKIETNFIWHNGKTINRGDATEHNVCHALHYGTSVFEGIRFYPTDKGPKIFRLKEHIERLFFSAQTLDMEIPYTIEQIMDACKELIIKNELESGYIRPIIYYGYRKMGLDPIGADLNVSISAWPWGKYLSDNPVKVGISKFRRLDAGSAVMGAKIGGHYFNSVIAHRDTSKRGYDEALLLDTAGNIAEGPGENIFFIKDNQIYTPKLGTILPGITRDSVIHICQDDLNMKVNEITIPKDDFIKYDEAFFTGTAAEITTIGSITDLEGKTKEYEVKKSLEIKRLYTDIVYGRNDKYKNWLY